MAMAGWVLRGPQDCQARLVNQGNQEIQGQMDCPVTVAPEGTTVDTALRGIQVQKEAKETMGDQGSLDLLVSRETEGHRDARAKLDTQEDQASRDSQACLEPTAWMPSRGRRVTMENLSSWDPSHTTQSRENLVTGVMSVLGVCPVEMGTLGSKDFQALSDSRGKKVSQETQDHKGQMVLLVSPDMKDQRAKWVNLTSVSQDNREDVVLMAQKDTLGRQANKVTRASLQTCLLMSF